MKKIFVLLVLASLTLPSFASATRVVKQTLGVTVGTFYGGFLSGPMRGAYRKSGDWAEHVTDQFGGGPLAKVFGYPIGSIAGTFVGGFVGVAKGVSNGIVYGIRRPLSDENFSVDGASYADFDPFDFNY